MGIAAGRHAVETVTHGGGNGDGNGRARTGDGAIAHLSVAQRASLGKAERKRVRRSEHADWSPANAGRDPIEVLEAQAHTRVPELVPIRYGRMLVSPFTFFRGAAAIMAADLSRSPRTDLIVQLCGDAHLSNFGVFAAPDRRLVFSVNDFDETLPGPFEWDLKRLVASFAVAGRDRGFDAASRRSIAGAVTRSYRDAMHGFAGMRTMDLWYTRLDAARLMARWAGKASPRNVKRVERTIAKARTKDSLRAMARLTHLVDGEPRIVSDPPLIVPIEEAATAADHDRVVRSVVRSYRRSLASDRRRLLERYRYVHAAHKVVGVGSVGTRAWIVLLLGRDGDDPLMLQIKEAEASVLEPFLGASARSNHGQRVVEGQRLMQTASDVMLGWIRATGLDGVKRDFYVRQLWDAKGSAEVEAMDRRGMGLYAELCGWTLARAHARSGDAVAIAAYLGGGDPFDRALAAFGEAYADQNERDYDQLTAAAASGRVHAEPGV